MTVEGPLPGLVLTWSIDGLSIVFVALVASIAAVNTLYALGHARHEHTFPGSGVLYVLFVLAMLGVIVSGDAFSFLLAWETMSLASFALVLTDHHRSDVRQSAWIYIVMTHTATAFIIAAFLVLARSSGSLLFSEWRAHSVLDPGTASLVFLLGLIGFGTKAGMVPFHVWLPRAHPVAPAHVSALMSGVMIKIGIYGLIRLSFDWLAPGPAWWGAVVLGLGGLSAVLGVLYALMDHDLKRLLAYHSVENIGIILMGIGAALVAVSLNAAVVTGLALSAALFHVVNHATFKALLFMCAGAVDSAVGTRDLEHLGGLWRRMPVTAVCFLVGSAAISGLPPLNGFASEWLTFQSLLAVGRTAHEPLTALPSLLAGGGLALTAALAVACFVKAFGIGFLAMPRSSRAAIARDVGVPERVAMAVLAAACVALGLAAAPTAALIGRLIPATAMVSASPALGLSEIASGHLVAPGVALALATLISVVVLLPRLLGRVKTRVVETWACGLPLQPISEYTSTAFAKPIRLMFRGIVRPVREVEIVHRSGTRFVASIRYRSDVAPVFERYVYRAATERLLFAARVVRQAQNGSLQTYLAYLFAALLVALALSRS